MLGLLVTVFWIGGPLLFRIPGTPDDAAWANSGSNSGSGSGNSGSGSGNSGSGSSGSGSGSSGSSNDDDDDDDDDDSGGSSGTSGSSLSGKGKLGKGDIVIGKSGRPIFGGDGIHVQFFDGHIERIRAGRFEHIDKSGRVVEKRSSGQADLRRLRSLEAEFSAKGRASGIVTVARIEESSGRVEITDFRGWRESLMLARYKLSDPNGHTVAQRPLTPEDIVRVRMLLFLN